jgi:hypothetical protein
MNNILAQFSSLTDLNITYTVNIEVLSAVLRKIQVFLFKLKHSFLLVWNGR